MPVKTSANRPNIFNMVKDGLVFIGSTLVAGTVIPISTATAATFTLYNPPTSGKDVVLISYTLGIANATLVVSGIGLGYASGLTTGPTTVTALTPVAGRIGQTITPKALLYSVATLAAATTYFKTMLSVAATAGNPSPNTYNFDGSVVLPPGSLVHVVGLAAQSQAHTQEFVWAEVPL